MKPRIMTECLKMFQTRFPRFGMFPKPPPHRVREPTGATGEILQFGVRVVLAGAGTGPPARRDTFIITHSTLVNLAQNWWESQFCQTSKKRI